MATRVDPNRLPSGTKANFLVIVVSSLMVAFWTGQFLPGLEYFTTPFAAQFQPGVYFVANGFYGLIFLLTATAAFCVHHSRRQRSAFGPADELRPDHPVYAKIQSLEEVMGVQIGRILSDRDITNADAISFGIFRGRTVLLGKRLLLMSEKAPPAFMARVAHELGHFKNGDVKYVMMSRALLNANFLLMAAVLIWMCARPARVVLMQYYLFTSPALGLPGASPHLFFKLHGIRWATYWLDQALGGLVMTTPVFVFWTALLFLEYRALLRTRELLADAQSAVAVGDRALIDTLTGRKKSTRPSIRERLYEVVSPHPLVAERVKVVSRPEAVLNPSLLRSLFLGYLWSLTTSLAFNIDDAISILNGNYGKIRVDKNIVIAAVSALSFEDTAVSCLYLGMFAVLLASYFLIVTTLLRSCISERLAGSTTPRCLAKGLAQTLCVAAGALIGSGFHPYSQARQLGLSSDVMLGKTLSGLMFHPIGISDVLEQIAPCTIFFATTLMFWIEARSILNGKRVHPIRSIEWILLTGFTFMFVYQSYAVVWAGWMFPELRNTAYYAAGTAISAILLVLAIIMTRIISGGAACGRPPNCPPPWLLSATAIPEQSP